MSGVTRIGHIALRVRDLDAAVDFQTGVLGLVETERRGGVSYLSCNERHHELILIGSGRRGYDHIGLEVADAEGLAATREAALRAGGEPLGEIFDGEPGIDRAALLRGPGGHVYKLFCGMEADGPAPAADPPRKFEHASVKIRNLGATERFLRDGLGFAFSDRMGRTASWWHCDADHHGMALIFGPRSELSHYAWSVADLNAMGRIADRLAERGRRLMWGPSRHGPGNNQFVYFKDADGAMVECCADLAAMPPHGDYEARVWPGGLGAVNRWGGPPSPKFILAGHPIAHADPREWLR